MNLRDELLKMIEAVGWTEDDRVLFAQCVGDWTALQARQLAGETVDEEMRHCLAQIRSIQAAGSVTGAGMFAKWTHWLAMFTSQAIIRAIVP